MALATRLLKSMKYHGSLPCADLPCYCNRRRRRVWRVTVRRVGCACALWRTPEPAASRASDFLIVEVLKWWT